MDGREDQSQIQRSRCEKRIRSKTEKVKQNEEEEKEKMKRKFERANLPTKLCVVCKTGIQPSRIVKCELCKESLHSKCIQLLLKSGRAYCVDCAKTINWEDLDDHEEHIEVYL